MKSIFESDNYQNPEPEEDIVNMRKRKVTRIYSPDGSYREFVLSDSASVPDGKGNWIDADMTCNHLDDQGTPLPDDLKGVALSHTGRLVPPGSLAICSSCLHPPGLSRNIYIGVDGDLTEDGPLCSICMRRRMILSITMIAFVGCLVIGLIKGLGWF